MSRMLSVGLLSLERGKERVLSVNSDEIWGQGKEILRNVTFARKIHIDGRQN